MQVTIHPAKKTRSEPHGEALGLAEGPRIWACSDQLCPPGVSPVSTHTTKAPSPQITPADSYERTAGCVWGTGMATHLSVSLDYA